MASPSIPAFTRQVKFNGYVAGFLLCYLFFWWPWLLPIEPSAWLIPFCTFVALPVIDALVGEYRGNWQAEEQDWVRSIFWPRLLPVFAVFAFLSYQALVAKLFTTADSSLSKIGWILTGGIAGGVMAINIAHELIHRKTRWEQAIGGLLLASVSYGTFKVEHVYGHHTWVATPKDMTSAPKGMTLYRFWWSALTKTPLAAIANAVSAAAGVRLRELPMSPPRILAALDAQKNG